MLDQEELTSSTDALNPKEGQTERRSTNLTDLLKGWVSGVYVAGDDSIHIWDVSSFQSNTKPLFVVDGMLLTRRFHINPRTVEPTSVLKDADTRALHGSRGQMAQLLYRLRCRSSRKTQYCLLKEAIGNTE